MVRVGIIGAGLIGLATARQLAGSGVPVVVWEKEAAVARHQSGHNSGVAHAGIYYQPGSAKARNCRRGVELLRAYCADRGLPWDERGKLVVARDDVETQRLREIERRSQANGVPGVRWLDGPDIRALEPDVAGVAALLSPTTAIVDFPAVARAFADDVTAAGGQLLTSSPVTAVRRHGDGVQVLTPGGTETVSRLVICAGLQTDLLARAAGDGAEPEIVPFRGEYLRLRPEVRNRVQHLIYPVPDPAYPFLGVHLTPRIDGQVDLGPQRGAGAGPGGLPLARRLGGTAGPAGPLGGVPPAGPAELAGRPARDARVLVPARFSRRGPQLPALARIQPRGAGAGRGTGTGRRPGRVARR